MRGIRRRLPSPAMVVALVALFSSLGGVSYGLAKGAINGREVKNRSLTGKDLRTGAVGRRVVKESSLTTVPSAGIAFQAAGATHFAAITDEGVPLARRGVLTSFKNGENGEYQVVFDKEIRNCAYVGTIVSETAVTNANRGQVGLGLAASDARALVVQTTNAQGAPAKRSFHLLVFC